MDWFGVEASTRRAITRSVIFGTVVMHDTTLISKTTVW